jgi:hypothetical protein
MSDNKKSRITYRIVKHFYQYFQLGDVTKKVFFAFSDTSRCGFEKNCSTNFAK